MAEKKTLCILANGLNWEQSASNRNVSFKKKIKDKANFQRRCEGVRGCIPWYSCERGLKMERGGARGCLMQSTAFKPLSSASSVFCFFFFSVKICLYTHGFLQWGQSKGRRYKPTLLEYKLLGEAQKQIGSGDSWGHATTCLQQDGGFSSFCLLSSLFSSPQKK